MKFTFEPESRPLEGFTIKRAIYRGGFGEVYYGLSDAGREVALKLLQNNSEVELRGVQQCLNLSHPNLVTIFDVKVDGDGDHWIIMEYVPGETLDAAIRRHPDGMPLETVRKWLPGIVAGTAFLHSRGLVHRDLKPANIFLDNGTVKVGDVGLSKFITPSRRSAQTQSVGTVYYMAPEVAKGRYGKEVDVYAAGVILYEMLTGQVPFDGESTGEILMKHLTQLPDLNKLPPRLRQVVGQALHKEPNERHPSLEALLRAFEDAVMGRAPLEPPTARDEPLLPEFASPNEPVETLPPLAESFRPGTLVRAGLYSALIFAGMFVLMRAMPIEGASVRGFWMIQLIAIPLAGWLAALRFHSPEAEVRPASARTSFRTGIVARTGLYSALMLTAVFLLTLVTPSEGAWYPGWPVLLLAAPFVIPVAWLTAWRRSEVPQIDPPPAAAHRARSHSSGGNLAVLWPVAAVFVGVNAGIVSLARISVWEALVFTTPLFAVFSWILTRPRDRGSIRDSAAAVSTPVPPPVPQAHPSTSRLAAYFGSAFVATPFTLLFTAVLLLLKRTTFLTTLGVDRVDMGALGMFAATALVGSWGVLAIPHLAAGLGKSRARSRWNFVMVGLLMGLTAGLVGDYLLVELADLKRGFPGLVQKFGDLPLYVRGHGPTTAGYVIYFGLMFLFNDWFKLVDPARGKRFSAGKVLSALLFAWLATMVVPFPIVWALGWAAVIACTAQLASPWNGERTPLLHAARERAGRKKQHWCNW